MKTQEEIISINKNQKEFYNNFKRNFATSLWASLRNGIFNKMKRSIGIQDQVYDLHKHWLGDLSDKKVLDLGCYSGNYLSFYLAENSKEYVGIDLSDKAIAKLEKRLKPYDNAKAVAVDFLSDEFKEGDFDLIYAYGVLHHFSNTEVLINRLKEKLVSGGVVISYDPLETSIPVKIVRTLYRPFQSDADWEWPFTKKTVRLFSESFEVLERRGLLGKSKWLFLLSIIPFGQKRKTELGTEWHKKDWNESLYSDRSLFRCMHLTMLMRNK